MTTVAIGNRPEQAMLELSQQLLQRGGPQRRGRGDAARTKSSFASIRSIASAGLQDTDDIEVLRNRMETLERDLERRQDTYVRRERAFRTRITELEDELQHAKAQRVAWMDSSDKIHGLKNMQEQIIGNVELVQERTAQLLQEQERDLLRAFRARLFDIQVELEKEKSKKDDGAGAWIERSRKLEAEVDWAKEVADRLERVNQALKDENMRLRSQFKSQEDDRNFLIKQTVVVKKENARLRIEYERLEQDNKSLHTQLNALREESNHQRAAITRQATPSSNTDANMRTRDINKKLKKLLHDERRNLQQARQSHANELRARTELEVLLRQCVDDVRKEIARRKMSRQSDRADGKKSRRLATAQPETLGVDEFTADDRERVLSLLLSQERVITLLYAKTFPVHGNQDSLVGNKFASSHVMEAAGALPDLATSQSPSNDDGDIDVSANISTPR